MSKSNHSLKPGHWRRPLVLKHSCITAVRKIVSWEVLVVLPMSRTGFLSRFAQGGAVTCSSQLSPGTDQQRIGAEKHSCITKANAYRGHTSCCTSPAPRHSRAAAAADQPSRTPARGRRRADGYRRLRRPGAEARHCTPWPKKRKPNEATWTCRDAR
jgi:hypothetical protein